tara:strand:+ start:50 stop:418 length:369 start_codon:yes stop_codon:yes gene_type:complete
VFNNFLLVFIGGGIGSALRFGANIFINTYAYSQLGTLTVNVTGSFLFGFFVAIGEGKSRYFNVFLLTGLLGGFTTFSQFSYDVISLQSNGNYFQVVYILLSVLLSISMAILGLYVANRYFNS